MPQYPTRYESTRVHNNMFGYRGVEWDGARGKFRARIEPASDRKRGKWLGRFDTAEEAALAYDGAAREIYGMHAFLNFPNPSEKQAVRSRMQEGFCVEGHDLAIYGHRNQKRGTVLCRECNRLAQARRHI